MLWDGVSGFENGLIQIRTERCPNEAIWKQICNGFFDVCAKRGVGQLADALIRPDLSRQARQARQARQRSGQRQRPGRGQADARQMPDRGQSAHESQNTAPVQVRALMNHQTLHLCKFERSRSTKHYNCAGSSAHEAPNITPVQVRAPMEHQTLHLCRSERSRITKHYTCAGSSAHESQNTAPVQVRALTNRQSRGRPFDECDVYDF